MYHAEFAERKIVFTDIAWQPEVAIDLSGYQLLNTGYFLPTADPWCAAVLNSPIMWWYAWRELQHGKDEALRWFGTAVDDLPCPEPPPELEQIVAAQVSAVSAEQRRLNDAIDDFRTWLQHQLGLDVEIRSGTSVEDVAAATKKARLRVSVQDLRQLRDQHAMFSSVVKPYAAFIAAGEVAIADAIETAFGLSSEQRHLMRSTVPPRTPVYRPT